MSRTRVDEPVVVTVGFAAGAGGEGIAYAAWPGADGAATNLVRVCFRIRPLPALRGRDVAYRALGAVAAELVRRKIGVAELRTEDAELCADLVARRALPGALIVPYVTLRCALNRLERATVAFSDERTVRDLTARARAEACLTVAA